MWTWALLHLLKCHLSEHSTQQYNKVENTSYLLSLPAKCRQKALTIFLQWCCFLSLQYEKSHKNMGENEEGPKEEEMMGEGFQ